MFYTWGVIYFSGATATVTSMATPSDSDSAGKGTGDEELSTLVKSYLLCRNNAVLLPCKYNWENIYSLGTTFNVFLHVMISSSTGILKLIMYVFK